MTDSLQSSPFMKALEQFEAVEANLGKLERLWKEAQSLMPSGVEFGPNPEYADRTRSYEVLIKSLPTIEGWKPDATPPDLDDLAQTRFDALEIMEPSAQIAVERWAEEPGRQLNEYRFRLNTARRALIRDALVSIIDQVDAHLRVLREACGLLAVSDKIESPSWDALRELISQIEVLLGSSVGKPPRWSDLRRHISFGFVGDLHDIENFDWPQAKAALRKGLYGANDPLPIDVADLSELIATKPKGPIATKLNWSNLADEDFERLIFSLISHEVGYENPEWLMQTRAPDKGRDLSVTRTFVDALSGTRRFRVVIQCKHWLKNSVSLGEITTSKDQMSLWRDPPVDELIMVTSGRFTVDAVTWVEQHNAKQSAPRIEMWAESHLERLLAARPALIAEFGLR